MKAFIKKDKWLEFEKVYADYGFSLGIDPSKYYFKQVERFLGLFVDKKTREIQLLTPIGSSPFMEVQQEYFSQLVADGFVEFEKGKFD